MLKIQQMSTDDITKRLLSEAPPQATWVFDCDGTLINGDIASMTAWALIRFGMAHAELLPKEFEAFSKLPFDYSAFRSLRKIIIEQKGIYSIYEWEAFLHAGLPHATSYDMAKLAVAEGIKIGSIRLTGALSDLAAYNKNNSVVVSGSPEFCVWAVADKVGIAQSRVVATRLDTVDGISAPRIVAPGIIWEELKRDALKMRGIHDPFFVAGDTIGDWQMMEMATHWVWAIVWDSHRHRGEEMRENVQNRILGASGPQLPQEKGIYICEGIQNKTHKQNWVIEVRGEN